jgi:hypothetical protein
MWWPRMGAVPCSEIGYRCRLHARCDRAPRAHRRARPRLPTRRSARDARRCRGRRRSCRGGGTPAPRESDTQKAAGHSTRSRYPPPEASSLYASPSSSSSSAPPSRLSTRWPSCASTSRAEVEHWLASGQHPVSCRVSPPVTGPEVGPRNGAESATDGDPLRRSLSPGGHATFVPNVAQVSGIEGHTRGPCEVPCEVRSSIFGEWPSLVRARVWGTRDRRFKSGLPDSN